MSVNVIEKAGKVSTSQVKDGKTVIVNRVRADPMSGFCTNAELENLQRRLP